MWSQEGGPQRERPQPCARKHLTAPCTHLGKAFSHLLWCTRGMTSMLLSNFLGKGKWQPSEGSQGIGKAFFPSASSLKAWLLYLPKQKRKIKSSSQTHPPSTVGRAVDTFICTCKRKSQGLRRKGASEQSRNNYQMSTSPRSPQSLNSALAWAVVDESSRALVTCNFVHNTIGSFECGNPRPEPYWTSSVCPRPVKQVMLLFCYFSFQTPLICWNIRTQERDKVFSLQSQRPM